MRARHPVHGDLHEGPRQLPLPPPLRRVPARTRWRWRSSTPSWSTSLRSSGRGRTETGDRAELETLPDDVAIWPEIAATAENCLGSECPRFQDCFITRMRQRAAESDVVIVNHHLLCADASVRQNAYGEVIPECHVAIIDEAHQLEDVATQYFGVVGQQLPGRGPAPRRRAAARQRRASPTTAATCGGRWTACRIAARASSCSWPASVRSGGTGEERRRVDRATALGGRAGEPAPRSGSRARRAAGRASRRPRRMRARTRWRVGRRAGEIRDDLRFLLRAGDPDFVYYLEVRGRGVFLRASPIDVSTIVRELLLDRMQATVLTSATLSVAGSFDYVRRPPRHPRGRRGAAAVGVRLRRAGDALPAAPDARSAVARRSATRPRREIVEILRRSEGRAFVLFTSYAMLRQVERRLAGSARVPAPRPGRRAAVGAAPAVPLARQRGAPRHVQLLAGRRRRRRGPELRHHRQAAVRLAGDPITAARIEAINARGESAFAPVPAAAGHPDAAAGSRPADPAPPRPRRPGGARSADPVRKATEPGSSTRCRRRRSPRGSTTSAGSSTGDVTTGRRRAPT